MSNQDDSGGSGPSAPDIITYVGGAVRGAGILPIIYNSVLTIWISWEIRRILWRNHISRTAATLRADIVNRVIEVEFERVALTPPDRDAPRYWDAGSLGGGAESGLPGGSWTVLDPPWERDPHRARHAARAVRRRAAPAAG